MHDLRTDSAALAAAGPRGRIEDSIALLPTPRATRGGSVTETSYALGGERSDEGRTQGLVLLPTPAASDVGRQRDLDNRMASGSQMELDDVVRQPERWGNYAPAIARWESILGRPAPSPTEIKPPPAPLLNRHGNPRANPTHRLSPRFIEWMMGLPDGHVTGVDISHSAQLKALGNGVVPQQAAAAITRLLRVLEVAA